VPAESKRLYRRIGRRDRWFLALLLVAALVATPAAVVLLQNDSARGADDRCVTVMRASIMGGATYKYCGASAVVACRQFAGEHKALAARCEALGFMRRP
jgi:hypothetical protein